MIDNRSLINLNQVYHEVHVAIFSAEILHELLKAALLSTHLRKNTSSVCCKTVDICILQVYTGGQCARMRSNPRALITLQI